MPEAWFLDGRDTIAGFPGLMDLSRLLSRRRGRVHESARSIEVREHAVAHAHELSLLRDHPERPIARLTQRYDAIRRKSWRIRGVEGVSSLNSVALFL